MTKYCPKCGNLASETTPLLEGFCIQCYFQQHPLIAFRRPPQVKICPRCNAINVSGKWIRLESPIDTEHLHQIVCELIDPLLAPSQPATFEVHLLEDSIDQLSEGKALSVEVVSTAQDYTYDETATITIPLTKVLCTQCQQTAGGYFEAILQIRTASGKVTREQESQILTFLETKVTELSLPPSAIKIEDARGGFDVKFTASNLARSLAKELSEKFGLTYQVSSKVAGRSREGKTLTRETYCLRFPLYTIGDVVSDGRRIYAITGIRNRKYLYVDLESGHRKSVSPKDMAEMEWEFWNDEIQTFQVISQAGDMFQLMNQSDYTIYDVPSSKYDLVIGSTVRAIEWKEQLLLLPDRLE